jgi:two-component system, LytTR family, sensor kinase
MIRPMIHPLLTAETARPGGREHYPLRAVDLFAIGMFWFMLALVSAAARELDPRIPGIPGPIMAAVLRSTYAEYALWAVLTVPIWWLASRYHIEGGRRIGRMLAFLIAGVVLAVVIDALLFELRQALMPNAGGPFRRRPPTPVAGFGFVDDLMVYFAVLGAGVARDYFLRYHARLEETVRLQHQLGQARLDALRAQLNPHFLFNTLNAVSALSERDPRGVRRMIARLSDLLRYTLDESTDSEVPLHRELDIVTEYIELMQVRFQGKLGVSIHVDDDVRDALVPNLILQPLVENAIKHGVGQLTGAGRIEVLGRREGDELVITVADSGPGPGGGEHGVGLRNTNARLREMYGELRGVTLRRGQGGAGTEAEIRLPFHVAEAAEAAR